MSTGCASILKGGTENVYVSSQPSGAKVRINGADVGETPVRFPVSTSKTHTVEIRKDGYEARTLIVATSIGMGWVILDFVCGVLPLLVDAATGDWRSLDQDEFHVNLDKK